MIIEPSRRLTAYAYDASGNRVRETIGENGKAISTIYEVNERNRLAHTEKETRSATFIRRYLYDDAGNVLSCMPELYADDTFEERDHPGNMGLFLMGRSEGSDLSPKLYSYNDKNQMVRSINKGKRSIIERM